MRNILYKDKKKQTLEVSFLNIDSRIEITFTKDCGKFGTSEIVEEFILTPERLFDILDNDSDSL